MLPRDICVCCCEDRVLTQFLFSLLKSNTQKCFGRSKFQLFLLTHFLWMSISTVWQYFQLNILKGKSETRNHSFHWFNYSHLNTPRNNRIATIFSYLQAKPQEIDRNCSLHRDLLWELSNMSSMSLFYKQIVIVTQKTEKDASRGYSIFHSLDCFHENLWRE